MIARCRNGRALARPVIGNFDDLNDQGRQALASRKRYDRESPVMCTVERFARSKWWHLSAVLVGCEGSLGKVAMVSRKAQRADCVPLFTGALTSWIPPSQLWTLSKSNTAFTSADHCGG